MIIMNLSGSTGARLNEFYCTVIKSFVCVCVCGGVGNILLSRSSVSLIFPHPFVHWTSTIRFKPMLLHPQRTFISTPFSSNCCRTDQPKQATLQGVLSIST